MGGPSSSDFFPLAAEADPEEFVQVVGHVSITLTLAENLEVGLDERDTAPK
jgi:hypothetical protein